MRLKWISAILFALILLPVLLLVAVCVVLDTADLSRHRDLIAEWVTDLAGRRVTLQGELDLNLSGTTSLVISNIAVANASWASEPDMLSIKRMEAEIELLPLLRAAGTAEDPSRVINIGSVNGLSNGHMTNCSYSASKAAVHHMSRVLAKKLAPRHITVNAVAPGFITTAMTDKLTDAQKEGILTQVPAGRMGEAAGVVELYRPAHRGA